jgi:hypothetical protein
LNILREALRTERTALNIEILGINRSTSNDQYWNEMTSASTRLCWLQDTPESKVWSQWGVTYRDVQILDYSNRLVAVYNLSANDLANPSNFETLKQLFIAAANPPDSNRNAVPDVWEQRYLRGLEHNMDADADGDGYNNFLEFALGTDPLDRAVFPVLERNFNPSGQFTINFNRWAGNTLEYIAEVSTNLTQWSSGTAVIRPATSTLYDGTGRSTMRFTFTKTKTTQRVGFVRLSARVRP